MRAPWALVVLRHPRDFEAGRSEDAAVGWTGIIARIATPAIAKAVLECGLPTIALDLRANRNFQAIIRSRNSAKSPPTRTTPRNWQQNTSWSGSSRTMPCGHFRPSLVRSARAKFSDRIVAAGSSRTSIRAKACGRPCLGPRAAILADWLRSLPMPVDSWLR